MPRFLALCTLILLSFTGCNNHRTTIYVPMPDGVQLRTEITTPDNYPNGGPYPVILERSPYGRETARAEADVWRKQGYVFVMQEIRGTSGSTDPNVGALFAADAWGMTQDGKEMMDWLLGQSWCNAQIGTVGYSGPALGEAMLSGASQDVLAQVIERSPASLYGTGAIVGGVPKGELDRAFWDPGALWEQHPSYDAFWATQDTVARAPQITAPALHIGGWYDLFVQGAIDGFKARQENGGAGAKGHQKLIIGPWTHDSTTKIGGTSFPNPQVEDSPLGITKDVLKQQYLNFWLKGEGTELDFTVLYYTMGALGENGAPGNEWHLADAWPPQPYSFLPVYLDADNALAGSQPATAASASYDYNPANPVPSTGGQLLYNSGIYDQTPLLSRSDVLQFTSDLLSEPVEVTGPITVRLYVSTDAVDTDFTAGLVDVYPNGVRFNITDGIRRLRYRNGYTAPEAVEAGQVYALDIDLWSTSYIFNTGHRLEVLVSSSNSPRFLPNPNNGDLYVGQANAAVTANNTVYFGGATPSAIYLPFVSK